MHNAAFALPLAAVLAACATTPQADVETTAVEVSVAYRERILLPPGHVLTIRLEDVSLADAPARTLVETTQALEGRGPPYAATLAVPTAQIDRRHTYAIRAEIHDPQGKLRFTTDERHFVLTQGARNQADIILVGVR